MSVLNNILKKIGNELVKPDDNNIQKSVLGGLNSSARKIPVHQDNYIQEQLRDNSIPVRRSLYRGQQYSNTDFSYNSPLMNESPEKYGSRDVGQGYHFTPYKEKAGAWEGNDTGGVIEIGYTPEQLLKAQDAERMIAEATDLLNDGKYMAKLWQDDPDAAEQIESIADGSLETLARRENKPFVQHIKRNDDDLATIYYYKDVDPELTDQFIAEFKRKAAKYIK